MWRAGPRCLLLAAACALGRPSPPSAVRCQPAGPCFSAHPDNASYVEARGACGRREGGLAWVGGEPELQLLLALLAETAARPALFWVGLRRNASACADAELPLRGFSWEEDVGAAPREVPAALGRWAKEPALSCITARCAGLFLGAADGPGQGWGWQERPCQRRSRGYVCRYREEGACPDLRPAGARGLEYRLPFGERAAAPGFSPPGTELAVACPGGEVLLRCQPAPGGFAWTGAEEPVCPCPFGYVRPDTGRCASPAECRHPDGGRACACAPSGAPCAAPTAAAGRRFSTPAPPGGSAGPPATLPAGRGGTAAPPPASSNYVFILVTVAVVVLVVLVMTVLGVFKLCFTARAAGGGDKEAAGGGGDKEGGPAEPRGSAGAE